MTLIRFLVITLVSIGAASTSAQTPAKRTPEQMQASYEAHKGDFDYLLGDWEFSAVSRDYGNFRGFWSAVRLDGGQILDEYRIVGDKGETFYLIVGIGCQAAAEAVFEYTLTYCRERQAFGQAIGKFQNSQFKLAEMATELEIGRHFLDRLLLDHVAGKDVLKETCMSKWWHSDMLMRIADQCLQLHGGYGYMEEYEVSQAFLDARVQSIFAGTNEIMKIVIAKQLGF